MQFINYKKKRREPFLSHSSKYFQFTVAPECFVVKGMLFGHLANFQVRLEALDARLQNTVKIINHHRTSETPQEMTHLRAN